MKAIILVIAICLMVCAQTVSAESEYNLGYKRGLSDAKAHAGSGLVVSPALKAAKNEIDKHPHAFYQGWLDGFCSITHMVISSEEFTFDCSIDTSQAKSYFMTHPGFWTAHTDIPYIPYITGHTEYHIYLYGTWPSSTDEATKIVNEHLSACLDFGTDQKPYLCHRVSPSQIPQANDSVLDAGIFVVPRSLNSSDARACVSLDYHNMYDCGSGIQGDNVDPSTHYLFYGSMANLIYEEAVPVHACADKLHFKEGTPKYNDCLHENQP